MRITTMMGVGLLAIGCRGSNKADQSADDPDVPMASARFMAAGSAGPGTERGGAAMALDEGKMGMKDTTAPMAEAAHSQAVEQAKTAGVLGSSDKPDKATKTEVEGPTRAWFPETFLFEPLVVTDDNGGATVPVRVPDRLTTWHVLALAHSRNGAQGGAVTSFLGTLPVYVELVVPKTLVIGDEVRVPIQLVNTTDKPVATTLSAEATNARLVGGSGARVIPAQGSLVEYVTLVANVAGPVKLHVGLGGADAIERVIEVVPAGKPMTTTHSGTLAAPRSFALLGPAGSDPATDKVRLLAFPGALALLRSELSVSTARSGIADDAYALLLAGKASALLAALGDTPDPEALRSLAILTSQRAVRDGRNLDVSSASLLTEAALAHPQNPVLVRLGERAASFLAKDQHPDGTFAGATGWTLQRVLVATAEATRAVASATTTTADRQRAEAITIRASGAFERNAAAVLDGYTAAAILASGAVKGELADKLRAKVRDAIVASDDGAKYLAVVEDGPAGAIVRADGTMPSRAEATALAVLALQGDPKAPLTDLGATLLGTYSPDYGWGDGRANLVCMRAVLELFKAPVPADVKISLAMDGQPIVTGTLSREHLRDVLVLDAPAHGLSGSHTWTVTADPPVPGLGYSLALESWVPWEKEAVNGGLELALPTTITGTVGKPVEITATAIAPSGIALHLHEALPAGVQVDTPSLEALVAAQTIERFKVVDGSLDLFIRPLAPGQKLSASYKLIPTLAGKLHGAASTLSAGTSEFHVPSTEWTIR
jgi:Alpha-2-macroglobulin family